VRNGAGVFTTEANTKDRLQSFSGGYLYTDATAEVQESYDTAGNLIAMHWAGGEGQTFTFSTSATPLGVAPAPAYLLQVKDSRGRSIAFTYQLPAGSDPATGGLLGNIVDPQGLTTRLAYDAAGNLTSLTWPDGSTRRFHYENAAVPRGLTGITDERGVRYATFGFDNEGRAISTEYAGGVGRYSTTYDYPPEVVISEVYDRAAQILYRYHEWLPISYAQLTTPLGTRVDMGLTSIKGKSYLIGQSQPAGSGCAASTSQMAYDANGNLASRDDFNGNRACYVSDLGRNLQTVLVEGLAPTQACNLVTPANALLPTASRKTSTEWHPHWQLVTRKAEPGRRTNYVYNGQPDPTAGNAVASCAPAAALLPDGQPIAVLCKQIEQATTDANGALGFAAPLQGGVAARTREWTYNPSGQVLTEKDALGRTTSYAYYPANTVDYSAGDLQSVTNAVGNAKRHTRYNARGQLLESVDPNGVATLYSYDPRGRVTVTSVGGQLTGFAYDASGQPTRTTRGDGSWVEYSYDAARRMNAVTDNLGNRIDYTLDNEGRVTAQTVKDPQGAIARTLSLSIDALGRVQQITGRSN